MTVSSLACRHAADTDNKAIDTTAQHHAGMPVPRLCATLDIEHLTGTLPKNTSHWLDDCSVILFTPAP